MSVEKEEQNDKPNHVLHSLTGLMDFLYFWRYFPCVLQNSKGKGNGVDSGHPRGKGEGSLILDREELDNFREELNRKGEIWGRCHG